MPADTVSNRPNMAYDEDVYISLRRSKDAVEPSLYNLNFILTYDPDWKGRIYFDELFRSLNFGGRPMQDRDVSAMRLWMQRVYGLKFTVTDCHAAVETVGYENSIHPVRVYLESLAWDGKPRLDTWLRDYLDAKGPGIVDVYGRKWMLATAMRALKPGCKADCALILYGEQGSGKSTTFETLGGDWFSDTHLDIGDSQKVGMALRGVWLMELAELSSLRKKEQEEIKAFLSQRDDDYRAPYGRMTTYNPRTCGFGGTTNNTGILSDPSGSRRYWVVEMTRLRKAALERDRDQLWAEAVHIIKEEGLALDQMKAKGVERLVRDTPAQWWLSASEEQERIEDAQRWEVVDPWDDILRENVTAGPQSHRFWTNEQIRAVGWPGNFSWMRLGPLLENAGWERHRVSGIRGWRKKPF